jgi:hypothetical protein
VFQVGRNTLANLVAAGPRFDYAALVLTADDVTEKRGAVSAVARDNIIFEAGLFVGALGPDRTFLVQSRDDQLDLPSDLDGVTKATYNRPLGDESAQAAIGPAATQIMNAIRSVEASGDRPHYLRALSVLLEQLTREELVRVMASVKAAGPPKSPQAAALVDHLDQHFEAEGYDQDPDITAGDLRTYVRQYEEFRNVLLPESSASRTAVLEGVLGDVAYQARGWTYRESLVEELLRGSEGERVVGLALARARPNSGCHSVVLSAIREPASDFEQAQALRAMLAMVDELTVEQVREARACLEELRATPDKLTTGGDSSRLILVEQVLGELNRRT